MGLFAQLPPGFLAGQFLRIRLQPATNPLASALSPPGPGVPSGESDADSGLLRHLEDQAARA